MENIIGFLISKISSILLIVVSILLMKIEGKEHGKYAYIFYGIFLVIGMLIFLGIMSVSVRFP